MTYLEIILSNRLLKQSDIEIVSAELFFMGCESVYEQGSEIRTYLPQESFKEQFQEDLDDLASRYDLTINYNQVEDKNWNEEWEKDFHPVLVDDFCLIRAPFHNLDHKTKYEIIIEPKMSFGTGHHETTWLMISAMRNVDFKKMQVLDMGSGTGVLAILAAKLGCAGADAIDIDPWAYINCLENIERNDTKQVKAYQGSVELIDTKEYDVILANINRNILLQDIQAYSYHIKDGGQLLMSGFFENDMEQIIELAEEKNFKLVNKLAKNSWVVVHMEKNDSE